MVKFLNYLMVWGVIRGDGSRVIVKCNKNVDSAEYQRILRVGLPHIYCRGYAFQHHGAPAHRTSFRRPFSWQWRSNATQVLASSESQPQRDREHVAYFERKDIPQEPSDPRRTLECDCGRMELYPTRKDQFPLSFDPKKIVGECGSQWWPYQVFTFCVVSCYFPCTSK